MENQLYQHITIFGRDGWYILRVDNDADTEKGFRTYNDALLAAIAFLGQCRTGQGVPV
jgi:hypothetical protein